MPAKAPSSTAHGPASSGTPTSGGTFASSSGALVVSLLRQGGQQVELRPEWNASADGQSLHAALARTGILGPARSSEITRVPGGLQVFAAVRAALDQPRTGGLGQDEVFAGYALNAAGIWTAHAWLKTWTGVITEFGPVPARYFGVALAPLTAHDVPRQRQLLQ